MTASTRLSANNDSTKFHSVTTRRENFMPAESCGARVYFREVEPTQTPTGVIISPTWKISGKFFKGLFLLPPADTQLGLFSTDPCTDFFTHPSWKKKKMLKKRKEVTLMAVHKLGAVKLLTTTTPFLLAVWSGDFSRPRPGGVSENETIFFTNVYLLSCFLFNFPPRKCPTLHLEALWSFCVEDKDSLEAGRETKSDFLGREKQKDR